MSRSSHAGITTLAAALLLAGASRAAVELARLEGEAAGPAGPKRGVVSCSVPGTWPHTRDAEWLWRRLHRAGYDDIACTGSAFVIDYGGPGLWGHDLYIWAFTAPRLGRESGRYRIVAGVRVYGRAVRVSWCAGRRNVWLEQGPTSWKLPPLPVLARLVRATTE